MCKDKSDRGQETWEALHANSRFQPVYPSDPVVRWAFSVLKVRDDANLSVLDVGCGAGRHAMFFSRLGCDVHAVDFSSTGVEKTINWAAGEGLKIDARVADAFDLPFDDESMDAVLCYGVLYYLPYERYKEAVAEIRRVLKPGGNALIVTRTPNDTRFQGAEEIGQHTYVLSKTLPIFGAEAGMVHCFLDRNAVENVFGIFSVMDLDRMTITDGNGEFVHDDWLIQLTK